MKLLHTADWHIGRTLYGRKRYDEHQAFLTWLIKVLCTHEITCLIIAGDIFDTTAPSIKAQTLYYQFLSQVSQTPCRHVIITGGNHDSPAFLNAPSTILKAFNIHVIGSAPASPADSVIPLLDNAGQPEAIVCAVPYLRDKDVRLSEPGESVETKHANRLAGIHRYYHQSTEHAQAIRNTLDSNAHIPLIATGHLFVTGGDPGEGVRELYIGGLSHTDHTIFPAVIDYVALGHLHVPQCINGQAHQRYSGSPIPMGYGELNHQKSVVCVQFESKTPDSHTLAIPCFQALKRLTGTSREALVGQIQVLKQAGSNAWLDIQYTGPPLTHLRDYLYDSIAGSDLEIRRISTPQASPVAISVDDVRSLTPEAVFDHCLDAASVPPASRPLLHTLYHDIMRTL